MGKAAMAIAAHPDDIELMMAGTLILLGRRGWEIHVLNVANGSCGTATMDRDEIVAVRGREARDSAARMGARFHEPLVDDLQVYYTPLLVGRLCAVIREVGPQVLLLPSPHDYMEDHTNTSRLGVTAAFCRNMRNFATDPPRPPIEGEIALYHALPWGLKDTLRREVRADLYVDIGEALALKRDCLSCHRSQKEWLDRSQGFDSYLRTMEEMAAAVARQGGRFAFAEGWQRHLHIGFGGEAFDPMAEALGNLVFQAPAM